MYNTKHVRITVWIVLLAFLLVSLLLSTITAKASTLDPPLTLLDRVSIALSTTPDLPSDITVTRSIYRQSVILSLSVPQTVSNTTSCPSGTIYSSTYYNGTPRVPGTFYWEDGSYQIRLCVGCLEGYPCDSN